MRDTRKLSGYQLDDKAKSKVLHAVLNLRVKAKPTTTALLEPSVGGPSIEQGINKRHGHPRRGEGPRPLQSRDGPFRNNSREDTKLPYRDPAADKREDRRLALTNQHGALLLHLASAHPTVG